jgi:LuxR family maltose regulon positive regulatory protein
MGMILYTKLQSVTLAHDIIPRARLLNQLENASNLPLSLLSAPAGYGKSTLASQWAATTQCPCGWLTLDEEHNDLHLLLHYLIISVKNSCPGKTFHIETLLEADPLPCPEELASYLLNDLHRLPRRMILILDDYHRIAEQPVHLFFTSLLTHASPNLHLAFMTRKDPPFPVATMRAKGLLTEIRAQDLRFTVGEITTFLDGMLERPLDDRTARLLEQKTEGWAAGIRLAGLYLKGQNNLAELVAGLDGNARYIADYLFSEIVNRLDPEVLSRLMELSMLDRFCVSLGDHIHQGDDSLSNTKQCIEHLLQSNTFITPLDNEDIWFRFHHLFQDLLKGLLQKQWSSDSIVALHNKAASWFAANGLIEEAIKHLLRAGNTVDAVQLIIDNRYALMNTSEFNRLGRWLDMLPERVLLNNPLLVSTKALIGTDLGKNVDIHAFTQKAKQFLKNPAVKPEIAAILRGEALLLQALVDLIQENIVQGFEKSRQAFELLPEDAQMAHSICVLVTAVFHQMGGDSQKAMALIQKRLQNPAYTRNTLARMSVPLTIVHLLDANLDGVRKAAQHNLQLTRGLPLYHTRTYAYVHLGIACYLQNDFAAAQEALQKAMDHRYVANPSWVTDAGFALVCLYLSRGQNDAAAKVLAQIRTHCHEGDHGRSIELYPAFEIEYLLRQKKFKKAIALAPSVDFEVRSPRYFFYVPQITQCKCFLAQDTPAALNKAHDKLKTLDERMQAIHRVNIRIDLLILLAVVCQKQGRRPEALEHLASALALAEPGQWIRSFLDAGRLIVTLLHRLADNDTQQGFIQRILQAFSSAPAAQGLFSQPAKIAETLQSPMHHHLTKREREILPLLAKGLSNKQIAAKLCISDLTVKTHLQNIYGKLQVKGRIEAVNKSKILQSVPKDN